MVTLHLQLAHIFVRSDVGTLLVVNEEWLREQDEVSTEELVLDERPSRSKSQPRGRRQVLQLPQLSAQTVLSPLIQRQWTIVAESSLGVCMLGVFGSAPADPAPPGERGARDRL